jgi:hypothetical protein
MLLILWSLLKTTCQVSGVTRKRPLISKLGKELILKHLTTMMDSKLAIKISPISIKEVSINIDKTQNREV